MVQKTGVQSQVESYQNSKNGIWCCFAYTQNYKVRIKGKVGHPSLHPGVVAIEKETFRSPSTKVANFTYIYIYIYMIVIICLMMIQKYHTDFKL